MLSPKLGTRSHELDARTKPRLNNHFPVLCFTDWQLYTLGVQYLGVKSFHKCIMPSNRDKKPKRRSDSRWYKAKHFGIRNSEMYDMSDNAKLKRS